MSAPPFKDTCFTNVKGRMRCRKLRKLHRPGIGCAWSFGLRIYTIVVLKLCHLQTTLAGNLTDQGLVAGSRGGENVSSNIVNNSAAGLKEEFVADLPIKLGYLIFLIIMTSACIISCVDVIIGKEILFHPYC